MNSFGRYVFQYQPGNDDTEYLQVGIQMGISAEASLGDMLNFFDSFLKASGYVYDGEIQIAEEENEPEPLVSFPQDFWDEDGHSLTGNPWMATAGSGLRGGMAEDILKFS